MSRLFNGFFSDFSHGWVRENPTTPLERALSLRFKIAKFEIDLRKTYEDIASQSREIVRGAHKHVPHPTNDCEFSQLCEAISSLLRRITFKLDNRTNFKTLFPVVPTGFPLLAMSEVGKTVEGFINTIHCYFFSCKGTTWEINEQAKNIEWRHQRSEGGIHEQNKGKVAL